jgi:hypothetical protein
MAVCRTVASADVMAITKWSISASEKGLASSYTTGEVALIQGAPTRRVPMTGRDLP